MNTDQTADEAELGGDPVIGTPEAFGALMVSETEKWKKVIEGAGNTRVE